MPRLPLVLVVLALPLAGCTEEGDAPNTSEGPAAISRYVHVTNLNSANFPWDAINFPDGAAQGKLKRWDIEGAGLIPVKLNGSTLATNAIDDIEARMGRTLFDRTSIANTPDEQILRGLIVSTGTAMGPDGPSCGHVGQGPADTSYPSFLYSGATSEFIPFYTDAGVISTRLYVNLSSIRCSASLAVAIHEFGHALGMGAHFNGFGMGPPVSENFWRVLYTLYGNPVGSVADDITVILSP